MITFCISLLALVLGYLLYGRFVDRVFGPDDRVTPAVAKADGIDHIVLPSWKVFIIQFLNIAGTGPIFGAIMGAKFGPVAYLWIVLGCIFAGSVHDYFTGMLSMRNGGASCPEIVGKYLGEKARKVMLVFSVLLLLMVGTVFVFSPATILQGYGGTALMWIICIFVYYIVATMFPIDKVIGRFYPVFAVALLFMVAALMVCLFVKWPQLPELWLHPENMGQAADSSFTDQVFPCMFITIACGALSGFHATQSPLMARCLASERKGRAVFYGSMITEGVVALVWAAVSMYFFYGEPAPGYQLTEAVGNKGFFTSAPAVVNIMCNSWLGVTGGVLAILGVVAAPITSGDTAFRSARLIIAEAFHIEQRTIPKRLLVSLPLFGVSLALLIWQVEDANGFNTIWQYAGWSNQALAVIMLWAITVYLVREKKNYWIALIPALFMTGVCSTFLFISKLTFHLPEGIAYIAGGVCLVIAAVWFWVWYYRDKKTLNPNKIMNYSKKLMLIATLLFAWQCIVAQTSGYQKLDEWVTVWKSAQQTTFGYPANQVSPLHSFYEWYVQTGMDVVNLNNAGDPMTDQPERLSSQAFEREVIEFFAPLYDFDKGNVWGIVTHSGTDGNNHGIYFGVNYLKNKTKLEPIVYVSDEAHYSNMRLAHLQNLEVKLIKSDPMGRMIPEELEKGLDLTRPALLIYAMGSTFKGAIDDQEALNAVLDRHPEIPAVYRHVDAALFGGYLPFTDDRRMVSQKAMRFESIAISGHKFFGIDSPCGLFLCTRDVYDNQADFNVTYLNSNMRMINCSRDALQPLKFWWLIQTVGYDGWAKQARQMRECTAYLKQQLDAIHWPCWVNQYSNTVFFRRPLPEIVRKYTLAQGYDDRFGGELAHVVVMQHVTKEKIDQFIKELKH